jgi:hypothetical protein
MLYFLLKIYVDLENKIIVSFAMYVYLNTMYM